VANTFFEYIPGIPLFKNRFIGKINRLVITHKDRLLRFGVELIFNRYATNWAEAKTKAEAFSK